MRVTDGSRRIASPTWRVWLCRIASITRLFIMIAVVSAGLLVLQTTRAVQAMRQEQAYAQSLDRWESLASKLPPGVSDGTQGGLLQEVPDEIDVAEALLDLRRVLESVGIEDYRSELILPSKDASGAQDLDQSGFMGSWEKHSLTQSEPGENERRPSVLEWSEPLEIPEELEEWRVALELQAGYTRLLSFLLGLTDAPGIWSAPRVRIRPKDGLLEAEMLLRTFARKSDAASTSGGRALIGDGERQHSLRLGGGMKGVGKLRDPFYSVEPGDRAATGGRESMPPPPIPGAIRWGPDPSIWIDGRAVRPGERVGEWMLVEVSKDAAVMRHLRGYEVRVKAGS